MKRALCILFALSLLAALCGCGAPADTTLSQTEPTSTSTVAPTTTVPSSSPAPTTTVAVCTHDYQSVITAAATCTEDGILTFTCNICGDTYTESIAATGHSFADATCSTPKTCIVCGVAEGDALAHNYTSATTEPTCTKNGKTTYTCTLCGDSYSESIKATGHDYENGKCKACGKADPNAVDLSAYTWYFFGYSESQQRDGLAVLEFTSDTEWRSMFYFEILTIDEYNDMIANWDEEYEPGSADDPATWYEMILIDGVEYACCTDYVTGFDGTYKVDGDTVTLTYGEKDPDEDYELYMVEFKFDGKNQIACVATYNDWEYYIGASHHIFLEGDTLTMVTDDIELP